MRGIVGVCGVVFCAFVASIFTTSAFALPAERHYEMVSPVFKGGFGASNIEAVSLNGEAVAFFSAGAFNGAPAGFTSIDYLARRGAQGWSTVPLTTPASLMPAGVSGDVTPSLDMELQLGKPGDSSYNPLPEEDLFLHSTETPDTVSNWEPVGTFTPLIDQPINAQYEGGSASFCHVLLNSSGAEPLVPEAIGLPTLELYDFDRGCNGEQRSLALVGLNNKGKLINGGCDTGLGVGQYTPEGTNAFNAVSTDGSEIFFTVCLSGGTASSSPHQVFVRLGGSKTLEVSRPFAEKCESGGVVGEVPCNGAGARASADFAGASEDGSRVFFTTKAALVEGDEDAGNDLYMANIGCAGSNPGCGAAEREVTSLIQVSHDPNVGQSAEVQGVVRVAPDGSRVYFVAGGDLLTHTQQQILESEDRPVPRVGAANLYVYDSNAMAVNFIGDLCSGAELSGAVTDVHCPSATGSDESMWTNLEREASAPPAGGLAQTAGVDGKFLVFSTYAQLLENDTNAVEDVYRYDAETGALVRVSSGEAGYDSNGNQSAFGVNGEPLGAGIAQGNHGDHLQRQYELDNRAISEDGSRIVFVSAEPLSSMASNGLDNAYEWHENPDGSGGSVSMISGGDSVEPVKDVVISPNGLNVDFVTTEGLVPQDLDGALDIYDARIGGGFQQEPAEQRPCEGDACQGPLTNPAPLLVPGSVSQSPGGNFAAPKQSVEPKKKAKPKKKKTKAKKNKKKAKSKRGRATRHLVGVDSYVLGGDR